MSIFVIINDIKKNKKYFYKSEIKIYENKEIMFLYN